MSQTYTPPPADTQVAVIKGLAPNDGGDRPWAPRNLIAFAVIGLFAFEVIAPYLLKMPAKEDTQALNLILTSSKTVETVLVLVLGFFFGTTIGGVKKDEAIRQALAAPPLALPSPDPTTVLEVKPPATLELKDPAHAQPDAADRPDPAPAAPAAARVQPGDGGPAE